MESSEGFRIADVFAKLRLESQAQREYFTGLATAHLPQTSSIVYVTRTSNTSQSLEELDDAKLERDSK